MIVAIDWLRSFVEIEESSEELAELLSNLGLEAEVSEIPNNIPGVIIGYVEETEKHPNADKLQICKISDGKNIYQIICGAPNIKAGQKIALATVGSKLPGDFIIKKANIRGVESYGMVCSESELGLSDDHEGILVLPKELKVGENFVVAYGYKFLSLEIDVTPNRPDAFSYIGVARDIACYKNSKLKQVKIHKSESSDTMSVKISMESIEDCPRYIAGIVDGIEIRESPKWIKERLNASGVRSINNVVDISNYVMLETGQPLHAFDYDLLDSDTISVRMANVDEKLITLDEKERTLLPTDIVITNNKKSVALGGVMGGYDTEIVPTSKRILLESATFDPYHIRITSSRLDLRSEASTRFERKVDPKRSILALEMATTLFIEYACGKALKGISKVDNIDYSEINIELSLDKINSYLGSDYSLELIIDTLDKLKFDFDVMDNIFNIIAPSRRRDILTYQDIIEEIGRIIGYDKLPLTLPKTISIGKLSERQLFKREIRGMLVGLGLNEVVTYALINENNVYDFVKEKVDTVTLSKPLSADRSVLSLTPINGVIDVLKHNMARKISDLAVYEIGTKYTKGKETALLCGAITGNFSNTLWQGTKEVSDFFLLKGILLSLFDETSLSHLEFVPSNEYKNLHPGQTASIKDRSGEVGFIGKLHPEYAKNNDLKDTFIFELDLEKIFNLRRVPKKVKEINKYPIMSRDIAIVVGKEVVASELLSVINKAGKRMLLSSSIFDLYVGDSIGKDNKSLAIRLEFSDNNKTLEAKDVDDRVRSILGILKASFNAELR